MPLAQALDADEHCGKTMRCSPSWSDEARSVRRPRCDASRQRRTRRPAMTGRPAREGQLLTVCLSAPLSGAISVSVWLNVQWWPKGCSAWYWRLPYSKSVGSMRIWAPGTQARSQCARASSTRSRTEWVTPNPNRNSHPRQKRPDRQVMRLTIRGGQPLPSRSYRRLSKAVPVYAAPDQDVCGGDMSLNSVRLVAN